MRWAVLVVWKDGSTEYVTRNVGTKSEVALFTKRQAMEMADSFRIGIGDDVQSISVVLAPKERRR